MPLFGLAQLMHIMVLYKTLGLLPGKTVDKFKVAVGHSQGIAMATAFSMLTDEGSFYSSLRTGITPGNCNADNTADKLKGRGYALYLSKSIQASGVKAGTLTLFGFGQFGGEMLIVHPDYLLATLQREQLDKYNKKLAQRDTKAHRYWQNALVGNHSFVQAKNRPPFTPEQEEQVYSNPHACVYFNNETREYTF
ncbi:hypothetical protein BX070DRAFT_233918 [Coemansia spiralis]|nr:hypothetical protein BX070DRAFT_233918 [Coemansia spiralis]